jgi:nicotinate (nicotinamide) nucleotide adenylyltransferase
MSEAAGALGILGGTFDPLHIGAPAPRDRSARGTGPGEVSLVPAGNPALRDAPRGTPQDRLAMVERALASLPGCSVDSGRSAGSDGKPGAKLHRRYAAAPARAHGPQRTLVLLLGADAFARLESWHRWRELFELAHIAVATRPGHELKVGVPAIRRSTPNSAPAKARPPISPPHRPDASCPSPSPRWRFPPRRFASGWRRSLGAPSGPRSRSRLY